MGAPLEICRKRSVVAVLASGVVISLTAMTGGIAPAFAAPKTDPEAPTTTVVAPEPKAPQEAPAIAEEPPRRQRRNATQAPDPEAPAIAAARTRDAGTRTGDAGARTGDACTAVTTGDADACAHEPPTTVVPHDRRLPRQRPTPRPPALYPPSRALQSSHPPSRRRPRRPGRARRVRRLPPRPPLRPPTRPRHRPAWWLPPRNRARPRHRAMPRRLRPAVRQRRQRRSTRPWCRPASPRPRR